MATPSRSLPPAPDAVPVRGGIAAGAGRLVDLVGRVREAGLLMALAAVVVIVGVQAPRYLSTGNIRQILVSVSIIAVVAVGQTLVVLTRNVDLSVASTIGLVAYVVRDLFRDYPDFPIWLAVIVGLLIGAGLGAVNGALVTVGGVPAIVATLGTLYVFRGLTFAIGGGELVTASEVPPDFRQIALARPLGIPAPILVAAAAALVVGYVLRTTRSGRQLYAVGSNPEAARLAGLPVDRLVFAAFVACGSLAAVGGILWAARFPSVDARAATGYELLVVAAVVLGGVNIFGGSGTVLGAVLGAIFLGMIQNALTILRLNAFWLQAISGAAILIAVSIDLLITRRLQEILRVRRQR
ncbi:MAG: ABC transporter permease [Chloroflexia bacterium]|nr:ABC transporter permease [Chloroflexia bacterium]